MNARRTGWVIGGLVVAGLIARSSWADVEPADEPAKVNENLVIAAQKTLEAKQASYEVGRATLDEVYTWSRRTVEASQWSSESVHRHLALMKDIHERTAARSRVGGEGGDAEHLRATEYYLAEAEHLKELYAD